MLAKLRRQPNTAHGDDTAEEEDLQRARLARARRRKRAGGKVAGRKAPRRIDRRARQDGGAVDQWQANQIAGATGKGVPEEDVKAGNQIQAEPRDEASSREVAKIQGGLTHSQIRRLWNTQGVPTDKRNI